MENYILNENKKRLEPTETDCEYCKKRKVNSIEDCYFLNLYNVKKRTNLLVYRSVKYSLIKVGIRRCVPCKIIHKNADKNTVLYTTLIIVALNIILFSVIGIFGVITMFLSLYLAIFLLSFIKNKLSLQKGILSDQKGAKQNQLVKDFLKEGWSTKTPFA
ncbi:MAG TPA: hypothetical protein PKN96_00545 [Flavobacterium sp.]|uniref:hypothetical protein n=1 Tax=Flavobacterium sp. TaxID=239 RepID=UPI002B6D3911|nr:hypothetical protein [Flavobacterium sp.]HNP31759.1 hypothetical protein [Flavobacterium sp.]